MNAKKYTILYLLLALAVIASSVAWMPFPAAQTDPEKDDPTTEQSKKWPPQYRHGRISARLIGSDLILLGDNLPPNHSFFVKVRRNGRSSWQRLGVSYSDRDGDLDDRYILPQKARKMQSVQVCLKDVLTNRAYCMTARR